MHRDSGIEGEPPIDLLDQLSIMLENLRKECYLKFAKREDSERDSDIIEGLRERVKD